MNTNKQSGPESKAPEAATTIDSKYTSEVLEGLEDIIREPHACNWNQTKAHYEAVQAGLAVEHIDYRLIGKHRFEATPLGIIVFDQVAKARNAPFRETRSYQKQLAAAIAESMTGQPSGANGIGEFDGQCACPMCGSCQPVSILRGYQLSWWIYQINNLARPERPDADVEGAMDLEFHLERN